MTLSRTERLLLIGALAVAALLVLDQTALSPLLKARGEARSERDRLEKELATANELLAQRARIESQWDQMVKAGLKGDPAEAESLVHTVFQDWARAEGLTLSLFKPERLTEKSQLPQIAFQATGTGNMRGIARLLWRVQSASIPIKVTEAQISARKDGTDDLSFQLRLSTVYAPSRGGGPATQPVATSESAPASAPAGGGGEGRSDGPDPRSPRRFGR